MKVNEAFERDYWFYLSNIPYFTFCGTLVPKHKPVPSSKGVTAKEAFYSIDTHGKNIPTRQPLLLKKLLLCKASVNFNIKQWAQSRADGTLPYIEFAERGGTIEYIKQGLTLKIIHYNSIKHRYNLPDWVIEAVERQKYKYYETSK